MGVNYTPFSQLPIPDKDAPRDLPYWFSQLGSALDSKLPVYATSTADRDSKYSSMPLGTLCASTTDGTVWVKTSAATVLPATWGTVYSPLPLNPIPIPLVSGYQYINFKPPYAVYNPMAREWMLCGNIARTDGAQITAFTTFANLPAQVQLPTYQGWWDACVSIQDGSSFQTSTGKIGIFEWEGNRVTYYGHDTNWISLDNVRLPALTEL